jgi:hypothetical protein
MNNKLTSGLKVLVPGVILVGAALWLIFAAQQDSPSPAGMSKPGLSRPIQETRDLPPPTNQPIKARRLVRSAAPQSMTGEQSQPDHAALVGATFRPEDYAKSRMQIFFEFQRAVRSWTPGILAQKTLQRDALTGEQTYEVYVYLRSCMDSLRSAQALERQADSMLEYHERNPDEFTVEDLENTLQRLRLDLARCEGVGAELEHELELLLADWLTLAAERGYPQAQLAYHQSIRWLLSRQAMTVYREPQRVREYRARAHGYLLAALRSGHSEAFVEYSLALQEGILLEQDNELAFAYARAADLAAHGANEMAKTYMALLEDALEPAQIAAARKKGRALCESSCL